MKAMMLLGYAVMSLPLFSASAVRAAVTQAAKAEVTPGYVRPTFAGMDMTAGYLTITNNTRGVLTLTGVSSPVAAKIEIHDSRLENGVVRMREVDRVEIPAGDVYKFEPKGRHLMLLGLKRELKVGETVPVDLHFDKNVVQTQLPVKE
jgi:copper(I)-binding protein